jgi:hemoglobin/transferrin/lactoferrin receptor protein
MRARALLLSSSVLVVPAASPAQVAERLDVITVESAARDTRGLLETPAAVTVRDREAIEQKQATTFEELIGDAPGVTIGGGPRGIAQEPNIRGFTDEQVALRFDGGRFNFNQAHRGRFFLDPEIVETVEIVRGGGSTLYGSGALGGVVSVRTREARDLLAPGETVGARVSSGFVSNGEIGQGSLTAYGAAGAFDALAFAGFRRQGADLTDGAGDDILDSATDADNALLKLGVNAGESHRFTLSGAYWRDDGTTAPNANAVSTPGTRVDRTAQVGTVRLGWDYAPAGSDLIDLSALVYGDVTRIEEDRDSDGRADETDYDTLGFELVNRSRLDAGLPVRLVYGVEAYRDRQTGARDGAARPEFPDASVDFVAGFAEATFALTDTIDLTPGARFDYFILDPDTGSGRNEGAFSPRLGLSWRPVDGLQLFGSAGQAFRAPSLTELYTDGLHFRVPNAFGPGTEVRNLFIPNPDLKPEKALQIEVGAKVDRRNVAREGDRLTLGVNGYYADVRDYVDQVVTFIDPAIPPVGPVFFGSTRSRNVDAELWGFEAEARYDAGLWYAGLGGMIPRGQVRDGGDLGTIPADRLNLTVGLRPLDRLELGGRATLAAAQDDVPEGSEPTAGYAVFDLFARWDLAPGVVARAGVDNLLDADHRIHPNGLPEPGRTFKLGAAFTF